MTDTASGALSLDCFFRISVGLSEPKIQTDNLIASLEIGLAHKGAFEFGSARRNSISGYPGYPYPGSPPN